MAKIRKADAQETRDIYTEVINSMIFIGGKLRLQMEALGDRYGSQFLAGRTAKANDYYEQYVQREQMYTSLKADINELMSEFRAIK